MKLTTLMTMIGENASDCMIWEFFEEHNVCEAISCNDTILFICCLIILFTTITLLIKL